MINVQRKEFRAYTPAMVAYLEAMGFDYSRKALNARDSSKKDWVYSWTPELQEAINIYLNKDQTKK